MITNPLLYRVGNIELVKMDREKWTSTAIPKDLEVRIKKVIKESKAGYSSVTQFVSDSCRRRLEKLELINKVNKEIPAE